MCCCRASRRCTEQQLQRGVVLHRVSSIRDASPPPSPPPPPAPRSSLSPDSPSRLSLSLSAGAKHPTTHAFHEDNCTQRSAAVLVFCRTSSCKCCNVLRWTRLLRGVLQCGHLRRFKSETVLDYVHFRRSQVRPSSSMFTSNGYSLRPSQLRRLISETVVKAATIPTGTH